VELDWAVSPAVPARPARFVPYFCRLLRSSIDVEDFAAHLAAVCPGGQADGAGGRVSEATPLGSLSRLLCGEPLASAYGELLSWLNVPVPDFCAFFENLVQVYGGRRAGFRLVLVFDQAEELFTRFGGAAPAARADPAAGALDWRLRREFFTQLGKLYRKKVPGHPAPGGGEGRPLPIHYLVSMRDEYVATMLDDLRRFAEGPDTSTYHLALLEKDEARDAIERPALCFGYAYSAECYQDIIEGLTKEERFIEPTHLQIVCEKLWNREGQELARHAGEERGAALPAIPAETIRGLGGTAGILASFFSEVLAAFGEDDRLEALEMLEQLVTASGTRNILEKGQLVRAPLRDEQRREGILARLEDRTVVRTESRLGGQFVEITHEFLIRPILDEVARQLHGSAGSVDFRAALRACEVSLRLDFVTDTRYLLRPEELDSLRANGSRLQLDPRSAEFLLRSALAAGGERRAALGYWLRQFQEHGRNVTADDAETVTDLARREGRRTLSLEELRAVNAAQKRLRQLSKAQLADVLRSNLLRARDRERDEVVYWTGRLAADER
jgi:hypothetical protein